MSLHEPIEAELDSEYTMSSASAVSSMIFGIASPLGICTCISPMVTSILAIVLGHISLSKIKKSNGRLLGRGNAIAGLILGYIFLPLSIGLTFLYYSAVANMPEPGSRMGPGANRGPAANRASAASLGLADAELKLSGAKEGFTTGNTPEAHELAKTYSEKLSFLIQNTIVEKRRDVEKSVDDRVIVNCQLNDDSVCFLVKIPDYRKYEDEAKSGLADMAWAVGTITASEAELPDGSRLGVGLKGIVFYGAVMVGDMDAESPSISGDAKFHLERFYRKPQPAFAD